MATKIWAVLAALCLLGVGTVVVAPVASAAPSVQLRSTSAWGPDVGGFEHIVGEVANNGPGVASIVDLNFNFYSSGGTLLATDFTFATVNDLNPGEKSPFEDIFMPPAGYNHYTITSISPASFASAPNHNFTTTITNRFVDVIGDTHFVGTVRNNNTTTASAVNPVFTFYNGAGTAVATDFTFIETNSTSDLASGATASFEEILSTSDPAFPSFASYSVVTQSSTPPSLPPPPPPPPNDCSFTTPTVGIASVAIGGRDGYFVADSRGQVCARGSAVWRGDVANIRLSAPIIAIEATPDGQGYWLLGADGGIFFAGDAHFYGSTGNVRLNAPVVSMATSPDGHGYWIVAKDGGIFEFGDAHFYGSTGNIRLNQPVDGMAVAPGGRGYWLVASDGGVFQFGPVRFYGSLGSTPLNRPIVGMSGTPSGNGYTLVGADGGVFNFGAAPFYGSLGAHPPASPIVDLSPAPADNGYYLVDAGGAVYNFGPGTGYFGGA